MTFKRMYMKTKLKKIFLSNPQALNLGTVHKRRTKPPVSSRSPWKIEVTLGWQFFIQILCFPRNPHRQKRGQNNVRNPKIENNILLNVNLPSEVFILHMLETCIYFSSDVRKYVSVLLINQINQDNWLLEHHFKF